MTIQAEVQSLEPTALIELFELDLSHRGVPSQYFHAGTNGLGTKVIWKGVAYNCLPIQVEGFELSAQNKAAARPKMRIANADGLFSQEVRSFDDLVGGKVIRRRTYAKFLDAVNFPGGNPDANPNQELPSDIWFVEQKVSENKYIIEWELASAFDLMGVMLPRRQVVQNGCPFGYRIWRPEKNAFDYSNAGDCGYTGITYFDEFDNPTTDASKDRCSKHFRACELRHPIGSIPFGGFPGVVRFN